MEAYAKDGRIRLAEVPDRGNLVVTVSGTALEREGDGLRIQDVRIAAGMDGCFRMGGFLGRNAQILWVERSADP